MGIFRTAFIDGIRVNRTGRRTFTPEYKQELVRKCRAPRASVSAIALAHGLNANVVRKWMRQLALAGSAPRAAPAPILLPVTAAVALVKRRKTAVVSHPPQRPSSGIIDIELNGVHIRLQGAIDGETLRCVLNTLRQQ